MKPKHTPIRTCVGCFAKKPPKDLTRLGGNRGVYICKNATECFEKAMKKNAFQWALKRKLTNEEIKQFEEQFHSS